VFRELLQELLQVPGANYSCIADGATGKVLDSAGSAPEAGSGVPLAVLGWGSTAAGFLAAAAGDELDDLIVTSRRAYHLVRQLDGRSGRPLLIYLRLDRTRANLAVARRALSIARTGPGGVPPQRPAVITQEDAGQNGSSRKTQEAPPVPAMAAGPAQADRPPLPSRRQVAALPLPRRPRPAPRATPRKIPAPVPVITTLPQRTAERPPPAAPERAQGTRPASVHGQHWADDVSTMRRLLTALRKLR